MPLSLLKNSDNQYVVASFNHVEFCNSDDDSYFRLVDTEANIEIRVKYVPHFQSDRDVSRFECFLFENPYLTAENDIFEVYESTISGRLGWIFPVSALDSNENDFVEDKSFKHYRHIAYQLLLNLNFQLKNETVDDDEYQISDLFHGLTIGILSKDEISKLGNFKILDYTLSFLKYGYLIYKDSFFGRKTFNKDKEIESLRNGNHKIKIKKAAFDITTNQYTNSLFIEHVYQAENTLTKFILLYQVLEHFIQENGDDILEAIIGEYKDKKITKNSLREKINKMQNDRSLLKKTFEGAAITKNIKMVFKEKCKYLFYDLKLALGPDFEDAVYDFRNLITHNYRILTNKTEELDELIYLFESIIIELLMGFNEKVSESIEANVAVVESTDTNMLAASFRWRIP